MSGSRVACTEIVLPEFGLPREQPIIPAATHEARIAAARQRSAAAGYDALLVYADREHFANMAYLTGFDPRFEESLLILTEDKLTLLVGNELHGQQPYPDASGALSDAQPAEPAALVKSPIGTGLARCRSSHFWPATCRCSGMEVLSSR
jgi:hypothetical protein